MGNVINLLKETEKIEQLKNYRFGKRKLTLIDEDGIQEEYMFIVMENKQQYQMIVTGYSKYIIYKLVNERIETQDFHAKVIISFLNYVFFDIEKKNRIINISELTVEHGNFYLRDYSIGKIGSKKKTKETIIKVEEILNKFYKFLVDECKDMRYLSLENFIYKTNNRRSRNRRKESTETYNSIFKVSYPNYNSPVRVKYVSAYFLSELLKACEYKYPELKLAICLQAFGGLRRGEVCNVSKDKIRIEQLFGELSYFTIDLREKNQLRDDCKSVGNIKKRRIQPIHPVFLSIFSKVYEEHMKLIKNIDNHYGALFVNRNGDALTDESYEEKFKNLIKIVIKRLSAKGDFKSNSELNILMSGRVNTHVLRHFFTKFIAKLETTRNSTEIAYWRGDSSLDSALTYLVNNPMIDEKIKEIQAEVLKDLI